MLDHTDRTAPTGQHDGDHTEIFPDLCRSSSGDTSSMICPTCEIFCASVHGSDRVVSREVGVGIVPAKALREEKALQTCQKL